MQFEEDAFLRKSFDGNKWSRKLTSREDFSEYFGELAIIAKEIFVYLSNASTWTRQVLVLGSYVLDNKFYSEHISCTYV